jgi:hypothetical protein
MLTLHVDELLADAGKGKADIDAIQSRGLRSTIPAIRSTRAKSAP